MGMMSARWLGFPPPDPGCSQGCRTCVRMYIYIYI